MSNKNSVMTAKERKVKMYDVALAVRNNGNECTRDYDEGRRAWNPPMESKPYSYAPRDVSGMWRVWKTDGRSYHFSSRFDALRSLYHDGIRMREPSGEEYIYNTCLFADRLEVCPDGIKRCLRYRAHFASVTNVNDAKARLESLIEAGLAEYEEV